MWALKSESHRAKHMKETSLKIYSWYLNYRRAFKKNLMKNLTAGSVTKSFNGSFKNILTKI